MNTCLVLILLLFPPAENSFGEGYTLKEPDKSQPFSSQVVRAQALLGSPVFTNVQEIQLAAARATLSGNRIILSNFRVLSDTTTLDDYLALELAFDISALRLLPKVLSVTEGLGVYYPGSDFFAKNVESDLIMTTPSKSQLSSDQMHAITAIDQDHYMMFMEAGTVLTYRVQNASRDMRILITDPDGRIYEDNILVSGFNVYNWGRSIIKSGVYIFRFSGLNQSSVSFNFGFTNNNRREIIDVTEEDHISVSLNGWGREYSKYRIQLNRGDLLELPGFSNSINLRLINDKGRSFGSVNNISFIERIPQTGTYFIAITNHDFNSSRSYSSAINVIPDPDIGLYPNIIPTELGSAFVGSEFSQAFEATGENVVFSTSGLPGGLAIDETTGILSGTPEVPGVFPVKLFAANDHGRDELQLMLVINKANCSNQNADINNDGVVNLLDLARAVTDWGCDGCN